MILIFPDVDTFRLVLTSGLLPADVIAAPAEISTDAKGRLFVDTPAKLTKKAVADLTRLGVTGSKQHAAEPEAVTCWPQILPLVREATPPAITHQTPILFTIPNAEELAAVVGEMMRLGNDRQSFRWIGNPADPRTLRVLLRVIGPPYYTPLRSLDRITPGLVAYAEQAPRVWVELGYTHPFGSLLQVPDEEWLLLRQPREWERLPEAPFQDVYDVIRFDLPEHTVGWQAEPWTEKLAVPLRLVPGNATDPADLWVLWENAEAQLDAFVRDADERILQRLKFAVGIGANGERVILLRTLPSKQPPPVLPIPNLMSFRPFWKLPNLYVPVGLRLHPTLRRDAIRKLLASDPDQLVWLTPDGQGGFTPGTIPEDAFRPLEDWVEYVLEKHQESLMAWIASSQFAFDHFICSDQSPPPKDGDRPTKGPTLPRSITSPPAEKAPPDDEQERLYPTQPAAPLPASPPIAVKPKSEWEINRKELEERFLAVDGHLDHPERLALWPELAAANAWFGSVPDAAICWMNALWEADQPETRWLADWVAAELPGAQPKTELPHRLQMADPTPLQIRQTAVLFLQVAWMSPVPPWLQSLLPTLRQHFEAHEHKLSFRLAWFVGLRLARLSGADVLGLARVRDRILQRLLELGLHAERDLPLFLRTAGLKDSERIRKVRESIMTLHELCRSWIERGAKTSPSGAPDAGATLGYLDLLFAFGVAKLGDSAQAEAFAASARGTFSTMKEEDRKIVCDFLYQTFHERIEQAAQGQSASGAYSPALQARLDEILTRGSPTSPDVASPYRMASYAIARMREQSRILEPQEKFDPYAIYQTQSDDLQKTLAGLPRESDPALIARKLRELFAKGITGRPLAESRFLVLLEGLSLASRVGESFSVELLDLVPGVMAGLPVSAKAITDFSRKQGRLLERALFLAAHFDRRDILQQLTDQFVVQLRGRSDDQRYELINTVAGQCLRSLRKLGLRDEINRLLHQLQAEVLRGETLAQLKTRHAIRPEAWWKALQTLLHLAGGWLSFDLTEQTHLILDEARRELTTPLRGKSMPDPAHLAQNYTRLAMAYVAALGHGPVEDGLARILELFQNMDPTRVTYSFTTVRFYSRLHLNLIEEVVLSVASDDFALGPVARRWLDEDEYLIRRRIHRDMKTALAGSEL
ncbi:MAG: hypothetical protein LC104_15425 [Bacteroidales bacterium]|nr:hypothetical protein [Bacteroidales bacterium]